MNFDYSICYFSDDLKELFTILYSEEGSRERPGEEQAWMHFSDFLDECEGKSWPLPFKKATHSNFMLWGWGRGGCSDDGGYHPPLVRRPLAFYSGQPAYQ